MVIIFFNLSICILFPKSVTAVGFASGSIGPPIKVRVDGTNFFSSARKAVAANANGAG